MTIEWRNFALMIEVAGPFLKSIFLLFSSLILFIIRDWTCTGYYLWLVFNPIAWDFGEREIGRDIIVLYWCEPTY